MGGIRQGVTTRVLAERPLSATPHRRRREDVQPVESGRHPKDGERYPEPAGPTQSRGPPFRASTTITAPLA